MLFRRIAQRRNAELAAGRAMRLRRPCAGPAPAVQLLEPRRLLAAAPVAVGPEFAINSTTEDAQSRPAVASDGAGHYLVAWQSQGQDGSGQGVYARRFNVDGAPDGVEFRVNTETANNQMRPSVAASPVGAVVVWDGRGQPGGIGVDVYAQLLDTSGVPRGGEFRVNSNTDSDQLVAAVAIAPDGGFIVAWADLAGDLSGYGIRARVFAADGTAAGPDFLVNTTVDFAQTEVSVASQADGRFVVVWNSDLQGDGAYAVCARQFTANGAPAGDEFVVDDRVPGELRFPSVAAGADGGFVVAWQTTGSDGSGLGIEARRYGPDGNPLGPKFGVNAFTEGDQSAPAVSMTTDGGFAVVWQSAGQDGDGLGVFARRFGPDGTPAGGDLPVNTHTALDQSLPAVAFAPDSRFLVAWQSTLQDGSSDGIFAQQFAPAAPPADPPAISVAGSTVTEGDAGSDASATFVVSLSAARDYPVSVKYATQDGTALAPADYTPSSGTLTFAPGETSRTVAVPVVGDALDEANEIFSLVLSDPVDGTLNVPSATATITDNDPLPLMSIADASVAEGDPGDTSELVFTVTLSAPSGRENRVAYRMGLNPADTATRNVDYEGGSGVLTFAPGETAKTIVVPVIPDSLHESAETLTVVLGFVEAPTFAFADDGEATGTIFDDDVAPTLTVGDVSVPEGNDPAGALVEVPVVLSAASGLPVTVNYNTVDDTAVAPADYAFTSGTLTFAPGETSKVIQVRVFGDTVEEPDETFWINLYAPQNADATDRKVTIRDDDAVPPEVTAVFVSGTAWTPAFRQYVGNSNPISDRFGVPITGGNVQLAALPWSNLNQLSVRFNRDVSLDAADFSLHGLNVANYTPSLIDYDRERFTYTFTFDRTLTSDRLSLRLRSGPDGVVDVLSGRPLDGEWQNGVDQFPSGDGAAGGDFVFALNVLPGDANRDGAVNGSDLADVRARLSTGTARPGTGSSAYSMTADVNGSGAVDVIDYAIVRAKQQSTLPAPPVAVASVGAVHPTSGRSAPPRRELFSSAPILG